MALFKTDLEKVIALKSSTHYTLKCAWGGLARAVKDKDLAFAACCIDQISALIHSFCILFEVSEDDQHTMNQNAFKLYMKAFTYKEINQ